MNLRYTRQRDAILEVLRCSHAHPTADWVWEEAKKTLPRISKGTVYRNLKMLCKSGEVSELDLSGAIRRFECRQESHYHFRCRRCGDIFDLNEPVNHDLDRRIAEQTGFSVAFHYLEFRGLCRDCRLKQPDHQ